MPHFIATSQKRPNAAQAQHLRKMLAEIDRDIELVITRAPGSMPCWIEGPESYGAGWQADKLAAAIASFRSVFPVTHA